MIPFNQPNQNNNNNSGSRQTERSHDSGVTCGTAGSEDSGVKISDNMSYSSLARSRQFDGSVVRNPEDVIHSMTNAMGRSQKNNGGVASEVVKKLSLDDKVSTISLKTVYF